MVIDDVAEFLEKKRWTIDWPSKRKKVDYRLTHQHICIHTHVYMDPGPVSADYLLDKLLGLDKVPTAQDFRSL